MGFLRSRIVYITLFCIIILHVLGWLQPVERVVVSALRPLQRGISRIAIRLSTSDTQSTDEYVRQLENDRSRLLTENTLLKAEIEKFDALQQQELFLTERNLSGIHATIIGRGLEGDQEIVLIDRGNESHIVKGLPVIANGGMLLGTIQEVSTGSSTVLLTTDARSTIAASVVNESNSPGLVTGQHGLSMIMRYIPQNEVVEKEMIVETSSMNEKIPAHMVLGQITSIQNTAGDLFQEAALQPLLDVRRIEHCSVLTP